VKQSLALKPRFLSYPNDTEHKSIAVCQILDTPWLDSSSWETLEKVQKTPITNIFKQLVFFSKNAVKLWKSIRNSINRSVLESRQPGKGGKAKLSF
jgi:hypothetical protein